ncbi:Hypothetical predicted protein [Lecanosticta acicola]|uniref:Uncharacterized protein n=1 Tax=Lecanosticta acicola TaxID=111012 RepID=A0AAI9ECQ1_9PEZI|nr:Hypothetical predicted protein [Lecanosticta acicola]
MVSIPSKKRICKRNSLSFAIQMKEDEPSPDDTRRSESAGSDEAVSQASQNRVNQTHTRTQNFSKPLDKFKSRSELATEIEGNWSEIKSVSQQSALCDDFPFIEPNHGVLLLAGIMHMYFDNPATGCREIAVDPADVNRPEVIAAITSAATEISYEVACGRKTRER